MVDRRPASTSSNTSTSTQSTRAPSVRRNLFHAQLASRRPTTSSTSTSAETLRLESESESVAETSDIVIRDQNGDYEVGDPGVLVLPLDDQDEAVGNEALEEEKEKQRLADAVKLHQRDRNRAPSEPAELLDAVKASLRAKVAALSDDEWMYEPEEDDAAR